MAARISLAILLSVSFLAACAAPTPSLPPTSIPVPTATPSPTTTPEPTATPTPTPPPTPTPEPTPTSTPQPPPTPEARPAWIAPISNAEVKFDVADQTWKYYSTNEEERGQYVVSVRQNDKGEYEFYNFAEKISPQLHPEVFVKSAWTEMAKRMEETGAVKALFCDIDAVKIIQVKRYTEASFPSGLEISFKSYPSKIFYPYLKEGQVSPSIDLTVIFIDRVNGDINLPIKFRMNTEEVGDNPRVMGLDEVLVGQHGSIRKFGEEVAYIKAGKVLLLGRSAVGDISNNMLLDKFVSDENGRLMHP